jgi:hypothetical protein
VDALGTGQPPEPAPAAGPASPAGSASPANALAPDRLGPAWPLQFAQVVVEILAGARSPRQIVPCTTDHVRAQIGALMPLLASGHRPRIQRILTSRPTAHAVEMSVVVSVGPRSRALAIRCEHLPARPAAPGLPARPSPPPRKPGSPSSDLPPATPSHPSPFAPARRLATVPRPGPVLDRDTTEKPDVADEDDAP